MSKEERQEHRPHPKPQRCPFLTVMTAAFQDRKYRSRGHGTLSCSKTSTSRGHSLTYHAQPVLAACSSAPAAAPPVAESSHGLFAAALPLLAATCPAVLR